MPKPSPVRSADTFRLDHNKAVHIPAKIAAALASMLKEHGEQHYEYEDEFAKRAKISTVELKGYREAFKAQVVEAPTIGKKTVRYAWFASPKGARAASKQD